MFDRGCLRQAQEDHRQEKKEDAHRGRDSTGSGRCADLAERGGRGSGIQIGERRFHLEGRQLGTEATEEIEE
jgi:hypothetical protein